MKKSNFLFRNVIIVIFISCERLILGDSKDVYIAGEVLSIFLYIGINIPAIGNLEKFCAFMKDGGNIAKAYTC